MISLCNPGWPRALYVDQASNSCKYTCFWLPCVGLKRLPPCQVVFARLLFVFAFLMIGLLPKVTWNFIYISLMTENWTFFSIAQILSLCLNKIPLCVCAMFFYPFISWWTRLVPLLSYCIVYSVARNMDMQVFLVTYPRLVWQSHVEILFLFCLALCMCVHVSHACLQSQRSMLDDDLYHSPSIFLTCILFDKVSHHT